MELRFDITLNLGQTKVEPGLNTEYTRNGHGTDTEQRADKSLRLPDRKQDGTDSADGLL